MSISIRRGTIAATIGALLAAALVQPAVAGNADRGDGASRDARAFEHVGTFDVRDNGNEVSEIVAATRDGRTLVYTDAETESIGFVDVSDPATPVGLGRLDLPGEPTSVGIDNRHALVSVNTSEDHEQTSGTLFVIDIATQAVVAQHDLPGQPDAVAISPDHRFAAVAIENERDEDRGEGSLPQAPGGSLVVVETSGSPARWTTTEVDLAGLADVAPSDPEPEYVDINRSNRAVVSLQENNHFVVVDLPSASVVADFPAGAVTLEGVDVTEEEIGPQDSGDINFVETITRRREPDTVKWIDHDTFASANEGDYEDADGEEGGSRGWTLFNVDGSVEHDAGTSFEYLGASAGHYNEGRSANKGSEPESAEVGRFRGRTWLFVGSERANHLQVLDVTSGTPEHVQLLPTGIGPEGIVAIENRGLLAVANETAEGTVPAMITLYSLQEGTGSYPQLSSTTDPASATSAPIPWVAQSGLTGDLDDPSTLWSVSDSVLGVGYVHEITLAADGTATIVDRQPVTGASFNLDLEGIADAPEGGLWLASEGRVGVGDRPNALVRVDDTFAVTDEVLLPASLTDGATSSGLEGVAVEPTADGAGTRYVYAVVQREWADDASGTVKIGRYEIETGEWTFVNHRKVPVTSPVGGWVGMSEITRLPDGRFALIERDNQLGTDARTKTLVVVDLSSADFRPHGEPLATIGRDLTVDVLDVLAANSVWTPDKLEGLGVTADGRVVIVTDNDGLDDALGQTVFVELGHLEEVFGA